MVRYLHVGRRGRCTDPRVRADTADTAGGHGGDHPRRAGRPAARGAPQFWPLVDSEAEWRLLQVFRRAVEKGLATEETLETMRHSIESGELSEEHYAQMWRRRLAELEAAEAEAMRAAAEEERRRE